ncbi:S1 RNA-binding domain-containing protein [Streptomyces sp. NPDC048659]|uniref:S1 RNA-binding domain-containing protein n=1 Tax=Streptomyces sp. NPDC048659 TaxID=3155489 RepID=UPI0034394219
MVTLDGFADRPLGRVSSSDVSWVREQAAAVRTGQRISAEVIAVDLEEEQVRLAMTATAHPELWRFLTARREGEVLAGVVAAVERFGVFVALDDGPPHPVFPGVGFITHPELAWEHFESATDVVRVGQRVSCVFLQFDTWNGEARLSLRAVRPDPFLAFADGVEAGGTLRGRVTKVVPFGFFVRVADGVEGLVPGDAAGVVPGDEVAVAVVAVERAGRRLTLATLSACRPEKTGGSPPHSPPP